MRSCLSLKINDGMNSHHFLRREHFIAGVEAGVENVKIEEFRKSFVDKAGKMPATASIAKEESKLGRRTGIEICP